MGLHDGGAREDGRHLDQPFEVLGRLEQPPVAGPVPLHDGHQVAHGGVGGGEVGGVELPLGVGRDVPLGLGDRAEADPQQPQLLVGLGRFDLVDGLHLGHGAVEHVDPALRELHPVVDQRVPVLEVAGGEQQLASQ